MSGAHVTMVVRNPDSAWEVVTKWSAEAADKSLNVDIMELNLLSLESVRRFSKAWNELSKPLNVLINNAGIFSIGQPKKSSNEGFETHMQTNHFAPALLTLLLLPSLKRGAPGRIININSLRHMIGYVDTNDMNFAKRKFGSLKGYCSSKLAQVMFAIMLQKRLPIDSSISIVCVAPGSCQTNVARDLPKILLFFYRLIPFFLFNAVEGSRTALFAAVNPEIPGYCAKLNAKEWPFCVYVSYDCAFMSPSKEAQRTNVSKVVCEKSLEMVGLSSESVELLLQGKEVET